MSYPHPYPQHIVLLAAERMYENDRAAHNDPDQYTWDELTFDAQQQEYHVANSAIQAFWEITTERND